MYGRWLANFTDLQFCKSWKQNLCTMVGESDPWLLRPFVSCVTSLSRPLLLPFCLSTSFGWGGAAVVAKGDVEEVYHRTNRRATGGESCVYIFVHKAIIYGRYGYFMLTRVSTHLAFTALSHSRKTRHELIVSCLK